MRFFHAIMNRIYTWPLVSRVCTMTHSLSFPCVKNSTNQNLNSKLLILKPTTNFDRQKRLQSISNGSHKSYPNPNPQIHSTCPSLTLAIKNVGDARATLTHKPTPALSLSLSILSRHFAIFSHKTSLRSNGGFNGRSEPLAGPRRRNLVLGAGAPAPKPSIRCPSRLLPRTSLFSYDLRFRSRSRCRYWKTLFISLKQSLNSCYLCHYCLINVFEFEFMWLTCLIAEKIVECRSKQELRVEKKKRKEN